MRETFFVIPLLSLIACVTSGNRSTTHKSCLDLFNHLQKSGRLFVGYGEAESDYLSVEFARGDLARQIRTTVSSRGDIAETNESVEFNVLSSSQVEEYLTEAKVVQRCRLDNEGRSFVAVVQMSRRGFLRRVKQQILGSLISVEQMVQDLDSAKTDKATILMAYFKANQWQQGDAENTLNNLRMCQALNGCNGIDDSPVKTLEKRLNNLKGRLKFRLENEDGIAASLTPAITRFIAAQSLSIVNAKSDVHGIVRSTCQQKNYPPMVDTGFQIAEILCSLHVEVDSQTIKTFSLSGKGLGKTANQALKSAMRKM